MSSLEPPEDARTWARWPPPLRKPRDGRPSSRTHHPATARCRLAFCEPVALSYYRHHRASQRQKPAGSLPLVIIPPRYPSEPSPFRPGLPSTPDRPAGSCGTTTGALPCHSSLPSPTVIDPQVDRCDRLRLHGKTPCPRSCGCGLGHDTRTRAPRREGPQLRHPGRAAIGSAGSRVFDGAPYNAELLVYPHAIRGRPDIPCGCAAARPALVATTRRPSKV